MTALSFVQEATVGVALLYAIAITMAVITALVSPHPDQRRTALKVLTLLVRQRSDRKP